MADTIIANPLEQLQSNKNWRIKPSTFIKALINEWTQKKGFYEVDIKALQRRLIVAVTPQSAGEIENALNQKKSEYQAVLSTLQGAEDLLVEYEKEESKLVN